MRFKDYLATLKDNDNVTFIKVEFDETNFHRTKYLTTANKPVWDWKRAENIQDFIVANKDCPPIDITGGWLRDYNRGFLNCCMLISEEAIYKMYPNQEQAKSMIEYYEREVK